MVRDQSPDDQVRKQAIRATQPPGEPAEAPPEALDLEFDELDVVDDRLWDPLEPDEEEPEPEYGDFWTEREDDED